MKILLNTVVFSYVIAGITLINSILMLRSYGLTERGYLVSDILYVALLAGLTSAYYEGRSRIKSGIDFRLLVCFAVCIFSFLFIEFFFRKSDTGIIFWLFALIITETLIGITLIILLKKSVFFYNICRLTHPITFLCLNYFNINFYIIEHKLTENYVIAALITLVFAIGFGQFCKVEYFCQSTENKSEDTVSGLVFLSRPFMNSLDKMLMERYLDAASLGSYVTLLNIVGIGAPLLNSLQQLGYHKIIDQANNYKFIIYWVSVTIIGCILVPIFDYIFYKNMLSSYYYLVLVVCMFSFANYILKNSENIIISENIAYPLLQRRGVVAFSAIASLLFVDKIELGIGVPLLLFTVVGILALITCKK